MILLGIMVFDLTLNLKVFSNLNCAKAHSSLDNVGRTAHPSHYSASDKNILIDTYSDVILSVQTKALTIPGNLASWNNGSASLATLLLMNCLYSSF